MADEEGVSVADYHVGKLEHDLSGEVVASGEDSGGPAGEYELHGGGAVAVGNGRGYKTWRHCIPHLKLERERERGERETERRERDLKGGERGREIWGFYINWEICLFLDFS